MSGNNNEPIEDPLSYQTEIMEQAKSENLIVCLPTGSGKTFIAVMLIKELSPITRKSLKENGKRTIVLVKTVELARQHCETMRQNIGESEIGIYHSTSNISLENIQRWNNEFETRCVLIFTVQIFLNLLTHNIFSLDKVNLLIFDECHHATGNDPYARIMNEHYLSCKDRPRILGLTASISAQKLEAHQLRKAAKDLEDIFHARIETGSDRMEIARHSTSVSVKRQNCINYEEKVCSKSKAIMDIFKEIKFFSDELNKQKKPKNDIAINSSETTIASNSFPFRCQTLDQLKSYLDNIIHIGHDLGLYALDLAIQSLTKHLKLNSALKTIIDPEEKKLYDKIMSKLDWLINNPLQELLKDDRIRFSDKVLKVEEYIKKNSNGQTIIFVERIFTAAFLCKVLGKIFNDPKRFKYLAGSKAGIDGVTVSTTYKQDVAKEFRKKDINVLISTAIIEEGLDVAGCNLVIRFNKPQNFSSYMQSKGRARAKEGNASFVLLRDEKTLEDSTKNSEEYANYEFMEKMLKQDFRTDGYRESSFDDDFNLLKPYQPGNGVRIGGIDAVQIIYKYCAILGNGQVLSPRFLFRSTQPNKFQCTLFMPGGCPISESIICENKNKGLTKQECCLKMVEKLHQIHELDSRCLPIRHDRNSEKDDSSDDENETEKAPQSIPIINKQISHFPLESVRLSTQGHLYRINISNKESLGFIVPCERIKVPKFKLYGHECEFEIEVIYLKPIDIQQYKSQLEAFCRYIFEDVFDKMNTGPESTLKFDIEHSTFQLLPCLLTQFDELDHQRMASICARKTNIIHDPAELSDQEVYKRLDSQDRTFYVHNSDPSLMKHASDPWEHKRKLAENINTYADHFEYKKKDIQIRRDFSMATMSTFKKQRINYLTDSPSKEDVEEQSDSSSPEFQYYPIEVLRYAPLNQMDFDLLYKLPSILPRISQLSYIEQLRQQLVTNIQAHWLLNDDRMSIVAFRDCLPQLLSSKNSSTLPLTSLHYDTMLNDNPPVRLSPHLLFQAVTRRSANEMADMENLEILGDCFLKLGMSMALYHKYPEWNAGKLTPEKDWQVSNANLYKLAIKKELQHYLFAKKIQHRGKEANWLPPGYTIDEANSEKYLKQSAKRKAFADMVEALIGAFLVSTDYSTTLKYMKWLGLGAIPENEHGLITKTPSVLHPDLSETMDVVKDQINQFISERAFTDVENSIGYTFKNKAYLIAAFTHPSYSSNQRITKCYDRLEYLGDAVLDFLVIRCIFVDHYKEVTPSRVTDIRQDLSNNGRLAYLLVSRGLHPKILHISADLFYRMKLYLDDENIFPKNTQSANKIDQWADPTAPKALADVFEALVGGIFLDSGYSLETVWSVIEPLLREYIDQTIKHPSLNPIKSFHENGGEIVSYGKDENGHVVCHAKLPNEEEVKGYGQNKKLAKYDACRRAMDNFKN